jgi:hypothetical protein
VPFFITNCINLIDYSFTGRYGIGFTGDGDF